MCHSIAGKGPLDNVGSRLSGERIVCGIVDARNDDGKRKAVRKLPMRSYKLDKAELDALVSFLQTLKAS